MTRYNRQDCSFFGKCQCQECFHRQIKESRCICPLISPNGSVIEVCNKRLQAGWIGFKNCLRFKRKER